MRGLTAAAILIAIYYVAARVAGLANAILIARVAAIIEDLTR